MTVAIYILAALVLLMLAGAIPVAGGAQLAVFRTPVFVLLLGALCVSLVACAVKRKIAFRSAGFHLTHWGVVLVLVGAFIGFLAGKTSRFPIPVDPRHGVRELPLGRYRDRRGTVDLGFTVAVKSFEVTRFDPDYALYKPRTWPGGKAGDGRDGRPETVEYVFQREVAIPAQGTLDLGPAGRIEASALRNDAGEWVTQSVLESGWLLQIIPPADRKQEVVLRFADDDGALSERSVEKCVTVNHPAVHGGWRFYLMSYDREAQEYVVLLARRDPGRGIAIAGMFCLMAGVALTCFVRRGGKTPTTATTRFARGTETRRTANDA